MQKRKTILFVDDDPVALNLVLGEFRKVFGQSVNYETASSAEEAEEIILEELTQRAKLPTMIVSDWMLPGKRGDQFLREVHEVYPEIKLVLHSGLANDDTLSGIGQHTRLLCNLPKPWDGRTHLDKLFQALSA